MPGALPSDQASRQILKITAMRLLPGQRQLGSFIHLSSWRAQRSQEVGPPSSASCDRRKAANSPKQRDQAVANRSTVLAVAGQLLRKKFLLIQKAQDDHDRHGDQHQNAPPGPESKRS